MGHTGEVLSGASRARWEGQVPVKEESDSQENTASRARTPAEPGSARAQVLGGGAPQEPLAWKRPERACLRSGPQFWGSGKTQQKGGGHSNRPMLASPPPCRGVRPYIVYF